MNNIKLVSYTDEEYNFVYEVKKNVYKKYVEQYYGEWNEAEQINYFNNFISLVKNNAYIIVCEDKKIGFYNGELLDNGNYEIGNICILPEYQGKGIGTKLLKDILEQYKGYNIEIQYFKSNPVGVLYKRLGFIQNGESKFHYKMIKPKIESSTKIIYFVHGTTTDNASKLCSGWKEAMFNQLGKEQAKNLGNVIREKGIKFDILITSDLQRAIDSSNIAFPEYNKMVDNRLRECNYGDLDGKHKSLVVYEEHIDSPFPNGESLKDVENRIGEFIDFLKENYSGKTVGIVAHRAPQLALEVITKNITWEEAIKNDWRKKGDWQPGWEYII